MCELVAIIGTVCCWFACSAPLFLRLLNSKSPSTVIIAILKTPKPTATPIPTFTPVERPDEEDAADTEVDDREVGVAADVVMLEKSENVLIDERQLVVTAEVVEAGLDGVVDAG